MPNKRHIRSGAVFAAYVKAAVKHPWLVSIAIVATMGVSIADLVAPLYLREFINMLSVGTPDALVIHSLLIALGLFGFVNLISWVNRGISDYALLHTEALVMRDLYDEAFEKLLLHSHEFFISNFTGTLTRRVVRYVRSFEQIFDMVIYTFLPAIVFALGAIGILAMRSVALGAGLFVWTVVFIYFQFLTARRLQPLRVASSDADSDVTGVLSDVVTNQVAVTTFAMFDNERKTFRDKVLNWYHVSIRAWDADRWVSTGQGLLGVGIEVGLLWAAVSFWQQGLLTVGDFVLIQVYVIGLMNNIWGVGRNMRKLYDAIADATEMLDIIERPRAIANRAGAKPLIVKDGSIFFDHVNFGYHEGQEVLSDCSMNIEPREKVAIVGSSGAGKSTITKLLLRLYDVSSGTISIDDQDIANATQESVRRAIAFVPQDPALFHRSLRENIRYGRADATDDDVAEAARQAHCLEFIERYPEGFDTLVGERGVKLSGGERQRVAIARAILKDAPILVLDEATSSLDSESEALIQDALAKLMEGKTVIAIAHRLSTIMKMDRIIVMEQGAVALTGTHGELLAQESNLYKKLWEIQAGGFISADK